MTPAKRYLPPVLALLLAAPLMAQEPNRNVRLGLPSPAVGTLARVLGTNVLGPAAHA
jgi:hypothetical protein